MIRGLIFDFDGLILETETPIFQSWQELYHSFGADLTINDWAMSIGVSQAAFDPYQSLEQQIGRAVDRATLGPPRRQRELELIAKQSVLPGVLDYLADAKRLGLKVGLASSSDYAWVSGHLAHLGLKDFFESIKTSDDVAQAKPNPDLYQAVLQDLELTPEQAIALEDSPNGILAAKRAGLFCVAVPNTLTSQLTLERADLRLNSLADLSLDELLQMVGKL
jgi:HAD superfamily hydrolase (TIGR01509 family)